MTATSVAGKQPRGVPLGVRLNNPLNIKDFHQSWDGQQVDRSEQGFCRFSDPVYGVRAAGMIILGYHARGAVTLQAIISKFAPAVENDSETYIANVSKWTGWPPNRTLNFSKPGTLFTLLKAMSRQEIGPDHFPDAVFERGADLALQKRRIKPKAEAVKEGGLGVTAAAAAAEPVRQGIDLLQPLVNFSDTARYAFLALTVALVGLGVWAAVRRK